jgi:glycosyltransferase involved in cell wall biosynthesis
MPTHIPSSPAIGIVVPAYNAQNFLAPTLQSLRDQSFADWVCVIVDDGSSDSTPQIAQSFASQDPRFSLLRQANAGPSAARNAGLAALPPTPFVLFHDADDLSLPHALSSLLAALQNDPHAVAAHALADWIDDLGHPLNPGHFASYGRNRTGLHPNGKPRPLSPADPTTFDTLAVEMRIYPMGLILIRRDALRSVGTLDPRYSICHDIDLFLRLATQGHFAFLNNIICRYRIHPHNISANRPRISREIQTLKHNLRASPLLNAAHRKILRRAALTHNDLKIPMWWNAFRHEVRTKNLPKAANCAAHFTYSLARSLAHRLVPATLSL